jgi:hypothetical protein
MPYLTIDRRVEGFDPSEALVYPLHPDCSHPDIPPASGSRVLISWRGRWIKALAAVGDLVETPPLPADSETFCLFRDAEEIDAIEANRLLAAAGFFPPPAELPPAPPPADPVERAVDLIVDSPGSVKLIRFLNGRSARKAHLDEIAVGMDGAPRVTAPSRRRTIRQRYYRARDLLDERGAPVRLTIEKDVVELVIVPDRPERATRM